MYFDVSASFSVRTGSHAWDVVVSIHGYMDRRVQAAPLAAGSLGQMYFPSALPIAHQQVASDPRNCVRAGEWTRSNSSAHWRAYRQGRRPMPPFHGHEGPALQGQAPLQPRSGRIERTAVPNRPGTWQRPGCLPAWLSWSRCHARCPSHLTCVRQLLSLKRAAHRIFLWPGDRCERRRAFSFSGTGLVICYWFIGDANGRRTRATAPTACRNPATTHTSGGMLISPICNRWKVWRSPRPITRPISWAPQHTGGFSDHTSIIHRHRKSFFGAANWRRVETEAIVSPFQDFPPQRSWSSHQRAICTVTASQSATSVDWQMLTELWIAWQPLAISRYHEDFFQLGRNRFVCAGQPRRTRFLAIHKLH